ncbi:MAG: hypothetical protein LM590_11305 [Thermofilum sp.]|jgi:hypothetical protein|nr:hypothetical protein [Thermofilum sp.]
MPKRFDKQIIADFGSLRRVWPTAADDRVFFTVGSARPYLPLNEQRLILYEYKPYNDTFTRIIDLTNIDKLVNTSGKSFFKRNAGIFIPAWNSEFYIYGKTYFKIFHSENLTDFRTVYVDPTGTYGNHFFANDAGNIICIGVGRGWKGKKGSISYTPLSSYLLISEDHGENWLKIYELRYPTAIYDGVIVDDLILFTARERKSVFFSINKGKTFNEIHLDSPARNAAYFRIGRKEFIIISSNDSFYLSHLDNIKFKKIKLYTVGLVLRYPIFFQRKIFLSGVGVRSWLIAFDLKLGKVDKYDITMLAGDKSACRLAFSNNKFLIGSELYGKLYAIEPNSLRELQTKDYIKLYLSSLFNSMLKKPLMRFPRITTLLQI